MLGDVRGKDVLELGCGGAQWSIALTRLGARCVGLDNSSRQLEHARRAMAEAGVEFPLVHASAEAVPLPDASFDVVFCDYGAMTFCDPERTVPEAARLLRPGGLLAFSAETPLHFIAWDETANSVSERLIANYFEHRCADDGESVCFSVAVRRVDPALPPERLHGGGPHRVAPAAGRADDIRLLRDVRLGPAVAGGADLASAAQRGAVITD
ncbi:MAG TPA: class I SAM-dependent methyltransferase [Candidatus Elarobacter sp.]|nr:class I SAM-dependent methyltransferase [Candidatus Elarobacter sp.]